MLINSALGDTPFERGTLQVLAAQVASARKIDRHAAATLLRYSRGEAVDATDLLDAIHDGMLATATRYEASMKRRRDAEGLTRLRNLVRGAQITEEIVRLLG